MRPLTRRTEPVAFMRGGQLYQIALAPDGQGYIGYCDGRVVSRGSVRSEVARGLLVQNNAAG